MEHTPLPDLASDAAPPWWQHLPGLVLVVTAEGRLRYTSAALASLHAASHPDGDCIVSLTSESKQALLDALSRRVDFQLELEWIQPLTADAQVRWFSCSASRCSTTRRLR